MSDFEKKILEFKNRLNSTQDSTEIESIRTDIFGKNGFLNSQFKKLGSLSENEKKNFASTGDWTHVHKGGFSSFPLST